MSIKARSEMRAVSARSVFTAHAKKRVLLQLSMHIDQDEDGLNNRKTGIHGGEQVSGRT